jgi:hypothetical protein
MRTITRHACCALLLAAATLQLPSRLAAAGDVPLSKEGRKALDAQFKGWQLAPIDSQGTSCPHSDGGAASFAQGDFNNDGKPDTALAIKTADGSVRLVVVFDRMEDDMVATVDSLGQGSAAGVLGVAKRGAAYKNSEGLVDSYASDTLTFTTCGGPQAAYLWNGLGFQKVELAK